MKSQILVMQKIHAVKVFLLPSLDSRLLDGDVGERQLEDMNKAIRASTNKVLKVITLPVESHRASWRDGEMSYPSIVDRRRVLMIRSVAQMILSNKNKVREAMTWFVNDEREDRNIGVDQNRTFWIGKTTREGKE
jgi:hypothetical protein